MASWLGTFAGNVESLLDRVDQVASQTFIKESGLPTYFDEYGNVLPPESQVPRAPISPMMNTSLPSVQTGMAYTAIKVDNERSSWITLQKPVSHKSKTVIF